MGTVGPTGPSVMRIRMPGHVAEAIAGARRELSKEGSPRVVVVEERLDSMPEVAGTLQQMGFFLMSRRLKCGFRASAQGSWQWRPVVLRGDIQVIHQVSDQVNHQTSDQVINQTRFESR